MTSSPCPALPSHPRLHGLALIAAWWAKSVLLVHPLAGLTRLAFDAGSDSLTPPAAWAGLLAFLLLCYCALSATSDLMRGLAWLRGLGPTLGPFEASLRSRSLSEFWQGTLGWLGCGKAGMWIAPVLIVLVAWPLVGLGGAQLLWLVFMTLGLTVEQRLMKGRALWFALPGFLARTLTFTLLLLSGVLLRSAGLNHVAHYFGALVGYWDLSETSYLLRVQVGSDSHVLLLIAALIVVLVLPPLHSLLEPVRRWKLAVMGLVGLLLVAGDTVPPLRSAWQQGLIKVLNRGNKAVFVGREGWLFDTAELRALTGWGVLQSQLSVPHHPESNAPQAILSLARQLKERGVPLLLVPLPMKATIYPDKVTGLSAETPLDQEDVETLTPPLLHQTQPPLYELLHQEGIDIVDLYGAMLQVKDKKKQVFFRQDSHWTPDTMEALARGIADHVRKTFPKAVAPPLDSYAPRTLDVADVGNLARQLGLSGPDGLPPEQGVVAGFPDLATDKDSPIVLLGGDDCAVYDDPRYGFSPDGKPMRSSLVQHLSVYLGHPLDAIIGEPTTQVREQLAARFNDEVQAKKLVIWVVPERLILAPVTRADDWKDVKLNTVNRPPESITPLVPEAR